MFGEVDKFKWTNPSTDENSTPYDLFTPPIIYIHNGDSSLLNGLELDFKDTLMGGGFNITNPNASRECGCGQSFG